MLTQKKKKIYLVKNIFPVSYLKIINLKTFKNVLKTKSIFCFPSLCFPLGTF